ncbi:hypothetical protein [Streptomyces sp. NPDC002962]|uniref:hypothetical protein n=1 Tax=Streptomyces sp. NPDC002962 TaxID=3364674 RepID=UPI00369F63CE
MPHTTQQPASKPVGKPHYLTDRQWAGLTLRVLMGVVDGCERAELKGAWASDLGVAAVKGLRARLDELVEEGTSDG